MWKVTIGIGKKKYRYCGHFKNEIEAAKTYDIEAKRAFGLFAYLNFDTEG